MTTKCTHLVVMSLETEAHRLDPENSKVSAPGRLPNNLDNRFNPASLNVLPSLSMPGSKRRQLEQHILEMQRRTKMIDKRRQQRVQNAQEQDAGSTKMHEGSERSIQRAKRLGLTIITMESLLVWLCEHFPDNNYFAKALRTLQKRRELVVQTRRKQRERDMRQERRKRTFNDMGSKDVEDKTDAFVASSSFIKSGLNAGNKRIRAIIPSLQSISRETPLEITSDATSRIVISHIARLNLMRRYGSPFAPIDERLVGRPLVDPNQIHLLRAERRVNERRYCEICEDFYTSHEEHIRGDNHLARIRRQTLFVSLDVALELLDSESGGTGMIEQSALSIHKSR